MYTYKGYFSLKLSSLCAWPSTTCKEALFSSPFVVSPCGGRPLGFHLAASSWWRSWGARFGAASSVRPQMMGWSKTSGSSWMPPTWRAWSRIWRMEITVQRTFARLEDSINKNFLKAQQRDMQSPASGAEWPWCNTSGWGAALATQSRGPGGQEVGLWSPVWPYSSEVRERWVASSWRGEGYWRAGGYWIAVFSREERAGWEAPVTSWSERNLAEVIGKKVFSVKVAEHWNRAQRGYGTSILADTWNWVGHWPWVTWSDFEASFALSRELDQRSLPAGITPWCCVPSLSNHFSSECHPNLAELLSRCPLSVCGNSCAFL